MPYRSGDHIFHTQGEFSMEVPPGRIAIEAVKGFEYTPARQELQMAAGEVSEVTLTLHPMTDMAAKGWYSGTTHAHMNYSGNLRGTLENMMRMGRAEGLRVVCALAANKDNRILDWEHFVPGGGEHPISRNSTPLLIVGEEYRPPWWGHTFLIGMRDHLISPFLTGYEGTAIESLYPTNSDMFAKAKAQGAITGYVHAFGGAGDPLERGLGGAREFPVDVALGTVDCLEWSSSSRASLTVWHHALNNDFPVAAAGGEDSSSSLQRHTLLGSVRTYAYLGKGLTARGWIDAVGRGRSFVSNGPLIEFTVENRIPGERIHLPPQGGSLNMEARLWSMVPVTRMVIYHNGKIWKEVRLEGTRREAYLHERVTVSESGWFALEAEGAPVPGLADVSYPQALTNPVRVYVGDHKIRSRASAEYFIAWIDKLRQAADAQPGWRSAAEKERVFREFDQARSVYAERAAEARQ
jgi:TolB protein